MTTIHSIGDTLLALLNERGETSRTFYKALEYNRSQSVQQEALASDSKPPRRTR